VTFRSISAALAFVLAAPVQADVYRWVDGRGAISYGEKPPAGAKDVRRLSIDAGNVSVIPISRPRAVRAPAGGAEAGAAALAAQATPAAVVPAGGFEQWREQCFAERRVDCERPTAATFDIISSSSPAVRFAGPR